MQQIYANTTKVYIDAKGQGNLLLLPLDKLMQAAGATSSPIETGTNLVTPTPGGLGGAALPQALDRADMRSRDALRSRDRGER
jgi:membrane protease subunit HflK